MDEPVERRRAEARVECGRACGRCTSDEFYRQSMAVKHAIDLLESRSDCSCFAGTSGTKKEDAERLHLHELVQVRISDHSLDII